MAATHILNRLFEHRLHVAMIEEFARKWNSDVPKLLKQIRRPHMQ
jgi:hypothetical protein